MVSSWDLVIKRKIQKQNGFILLSSSGERGVRIIQKKTNLNLVFLWKIRKSLLKKGFGNFAAPFSFPPYLLTSHLSPCGSLSLRLRWTLSWSLWWRGRRRSGRSWWTGGRWCQRHWTSKAFVELMIGPSAHRCNIFNILCARPL